jgi:hypothetical protein
MNTLYCATCLRALQQGEQAWASDWKVLDVSGDTAVWRNETRYTCDECEATQ